MHGAAVVDEALRDVGGTTRRLVFVPAVHADDLDTARLVPLNPPAKRVKRDAADTGLVPVAGPTASSAAASARPARAEPPSRAAPPLSRLQSRWPTVLKARLAWAAQEPRFLKRDGRWAQA